jgi:hypothetical protein
MMTRVSYLGSGSTITSDGKDFLEKRDSLIPKVLAHGTTKPAGRTL